MGALFAPVARADIPLSKVLEGLVILRKNPDYVPEAVPERK